MLYGKKVKLRTAEKSDMEFLAQVYNDPKVNQFDLNFVAGFSKEYMEKEYDGDIKHSLKNTYGDHFIILNEEGKPAGSIGFWKNSDRRLIFMIGLTISSEYWSCGYGQDAINTLLKYLFLQRDAAKVELIVRDMNPRAIRCYEKCGFVKEALLRESEFAGGKVISYYYMGVLREEFLTRGDI